MLLNMCSNFFFVLYSVRMSIMPMKYTHDFSMLGIPFSHRSLKATGPISDVFEYLSYVLKKCCPALGIGELYKSLYSDIRY